MTEEELFQSALERPAAERAAFLASACDGDDALLRRVEVLLRAHDNPGTFLQEPALPPDDRTEDYRVSADQPGSYVGPYKLLQRIGEGGMGAVYMAEQTTPVHRRVAVKLIRPGADSRMVLARFEAERQALALMDHPNIAKVLDAGATEDSRPYFVMELVKGTPITKFCDERRLTPRERLELFVPVCQAIQHAHQKGVIHRDIKPSNVLVALYDGRPVPKVIDFGVAKATGQQLTDKTLFTGFGSVVGTLEYMSPEQAEPNQLDIDTRSDVYSLGVLLYELLTGTTPLPRKRLREAGLLELLRVIREEEPPRPSTRLSTTDELPSIAAARGLEPRRLTGLVRGDLDWLVMKALDKDRSRRYETANGFAVDVQRFLADEPVSACPPSVWYRGRKFARRNRTAVLATGLVVAALLIGVVVSTLMAVWARRAEDDALKAAASEREAKDAEVVQRRQAESVARLMESAFEGLDPSAPPDELRRQLLTRLSAAAAELGPGGAGDPLTTARLQLALGKTFIALGESKQASPLLTQARETFLRHQGPNSLDALACDYAIGLSLVLSIGSSKEAVPFIERVLAGREALIGPNHDDTISTLLLLGDAYSNLGDPRTEDVFQRAWDRARAAHGDDHLLTNQAKESVGSALLHGGEVGRGIRLMAEAHEWNKTRMGLDHPATLAQAKDLVYAFGALGEYEKALPVNQMMVRGYETREGPNHYRTLASMTRLVRNHEVLKQTDDAERLLKELAGRAARVTGSDVNQLALTLTDVAIALLDRKRYAAAEPLFRDALAHRERSNPNYWETYYVRLLLGTTLAGQRKDAEAGPLLRSGYDGLRARRAELTGPVRVRVTAALQRLIALYDAAGMPDEAKTWRNRLNEYRN